ncbi:hypothetical protein NC651_001782 [Populus alba x Populus x berolinensis]|nr:hypothetical protein NC651_001782 [Populus alba x Populus x berolinensis]
MDKRFWDPERIPEYTASCKGEPKKRAQTISQSPLKLVFPTTQCLIACAGFSMETEVGVEGNDEAKHKECGIRKSSSSLSSPKQISDPVVYKLVRVEGDGRLVPATDDELVEVGSLLIDDRCGMHVVADPGQTVGCISNEGSSSGMAQLKRLEGWSQPENKKVDPDKLNGRLEEPVPLLAPSLSESHLNQSGSVGECSHPPDELVAGGSPSSITTKPDFSRLKGEICLDNLSIKELHETFKATFGRETTVKDKQWLKRRISMGLTNSCDVSTTSFIIKDNKFVKKGNEEGCNSMYGSFANDPPIVNQKGLPTCHVGQLDYHKVVPERRLENHNLDDNSGSDDHQKEQRAAKRVRKPTKRYIEELSEVESKESNERLLNLAKNSGHDGLISPKSHVRLVRNVSSGGRTVITRLDSLGGSGIQVPCVSRVRRSRPRKNFMALLKFNPSSMGMAAALVEKALDDHGFPPDDGNENRVLKASSTPEHVHHQFVGVPEKDKQFSVMSAVGLGNNTDLKCMNSNEDSDDNAVTVPTSKGGIRRKHHRAWTLSEVMKLVEGVSRYGAGRWSEIKRLAFASYSYRTSVDLKDKWRNLLKASFAQTPPDTGMNSRKNTGAMPIPTPILLKVRELAEMQAQVPQNLSSTKVAGSARKIVHEKQTGEESSHRQNANSSETLLYIGTWKAAFDALACVVSLRLKWERGWVGPSKQLHHILKCLKYTEYHLGQLKAKIAKLRTQLLEPPKGSSGAGDGFEVTKFGHGRVALIGFPSVGKSTLLTMLTGTHSEAASYEFTTLTCIPGIIHYNDTKIQLLDLPGIIEGASEGKGRGRQVIAVSKSSDIVLMVLDASKSEGHRQILTKELEAVGLRLNKKPPRIYFKKKKTGGISFNSTLTLTHVDEKLCYQILHEYKIHNAEILFREDATVDDLIDVIEGNRKYMKCIYVYNKIDVIGIDDVDKLARQPNSVLNFDRLLAKMWEEMGLVRVYTKPQGQQPDFTDPVVLSTDRGGCMVEDFCNHIHRNLIKDVKYVLVWGTSARHHPQHCGLGHALHDEDMVQIVKRKEREEGGRGRFKSHSTDPARICDREKKAPLKT